MRNMGRDKRAFFAQAGIKLASSWPGNSTVLNLIIWLKSQMKKLQLGLQVQAQENCSQGVEEHHTTLHSFT